MKTVFIKQTHSLFLLCAVLLSSVSFETFCVRKPSELQQIRKERKQNERRLNLWTCASCVIMGLGIYLAASTFPPAQINQPSPVVETTPITPAHPVYIAPSIGVPHLFKDR